ncbi:sensor domain-containing diguanylate cyclase [Paucibacter soli]|uniref:sensor domain-containing diguanylate cyclase n=1 Tax=Paucibacter soli TaxID=3133433 RepID=UPI003097D652
MRLFDSDDELAALERRVAGLAQASEDPQAWVELAWQLRQRDSTRALALAEAARSAIAAMPRQAVPPKLRAAWTARLALVRGEVQGLAGDYAAARHEFDTALRSFRRLGDAVGVGDTHWLSLTLAIDHGDVKRRDQELQAAIQAYAQAGDALRHGIADLRRSWYLASADPEAARQHLQAFDREAAGLHHPSLMAWRSWVQAYLQPLGGQAILANLSSYQLAQQSGQLRMAITAALAAGDKLMDLNDADGALEWMERGLDLARRAAWRPVIATCLQQTANVLRVLGRHEAAAEMLRQALADALPGSRNQVIALHYMGLLAMETGALCSAADMLARAEHGFRRLGVLRPLIRVQYGRAKALLRLGRFEQAQALAQAALQSAQAHDLREDQISAYRVLAELEQARPGGSAEQGLRLLRAAQAIAGSIEGYLAPPDLLEALAAGHAAAQRYQEAYQLAMEANAVRQQAHGRSAINRAVSLQVAQDTERLRAQAERLRLLARAEAERADLLQQGNQTLQHLSAIGRELTARLDVTQIAALLERHVKAMLDAYSFLCYRVDESGERLLPVLCLEGGQPVQAPAVSLADPKRQTARCARERCEMVLHVEPEPDQVLPGTVACRSLMFAPLQLAGRLLGVLSIQSPRANAYGERELAIFRSLSAYSAIALANADAMSSLSQAQHELQAKNRELERLAITDALTGLYNRRYLDMVLERELRRAQRYGTELSVILLDLDHFKHINDRYGHQLGDQVLVSVAALLRTRLRDSDVAGRWGGEEFLIICASTSEPGASAVAEQVRRHVAGLPLPQRGHCSASFGVAQLREGETAAGLLARADAALYRAKQSGRNRVLSDASPQRS